MGIQHAYTQTVADGTATSVVRPSDWNSNHVQFWTITGNTVSNSTVSGTNVVLSAGPNVTIGGTSNTIVFSAPPAQTVQPVAASGSNGSFAFSTLSFGNSNSVSFYTSNGSIVASVLPDGPQGIAAGTQTGTSGNIVFSNSNNVSFGMNNSSVVTASASFNQTVQPAVGQLNGSSGTMSLAVGSSLSSSTNGSTITFGLASNITTALQSAGAYLTTAMQSNAGTNFLGTNTALTANGLSVTANSSGLSINMPAFDYASATTKYAGIGTSATNASITLNSNGLAISVAAPGGGGAINVSGGTTSGNLQTIVFSNSNGVSFGLNGSTITASAAGGGGAFSAGVSTDAAGTTGFVGNQILFSEGNTNITLSQSINGGSATISIFGPPAVTGAWFQPEIMGAQTFLNPANGSIYIRPIELDGYYDVDRYMMMQNMVTGTSTMSYSASVSSQTSSAGTGSWGQTGTMLLWSRANTNETHASYNSIITMDSRTWSMSNGYSCSVSWSTNVSSATASVTTSGAFGYLKNIDGNGGFTTSSSGTSGSTSFSSTSTNQNSFSSSFGLTFANAYMTGTRPLFIPCAGSAIPPGEYWVGFIQSTATASTNYPLNRCAQLSVSGMLHYTASTYSYFEYGNSATLNNSSNYRLGFGSYSATTATTNPIALTNISQMISNASLWVAFDGKTM